MDLISMMETKLTLSSDIAANWKSPSKFFWKNPVSAVLYNNYLFMHILSYWDYSEDVALLVHSLCKSKRLLTSDHTENSEAS